MSTISNDNNLNNNSKDLLSILEDTVLKQYSYTEIASYLNVAIGTVKRWVELKNVPRSYSFDLMKLANIPIDYSVFTYKDKDQFFTPDTVAKECVDKFISILHEYGDCETDYLFVEPSAGDGKFMNYLPKERRIGFDIEPMHEEVIKTDYLDWNPVDNTSKYVVIGNPPFGLRGQLALKFINHSSSFADYVCFILPQLFESDGKGVPRKRVKGFNLIHSEKLNTGFYSPNGKDVKVECIFQVWSKFHTNSKYEIKEFNKQSPTLRVFSLSDGGTPSTTRNKKMFYTCDAYLPSTCFGKENMRYYDTFDSLPKKKGYGIVFYKDKTENIEKFKTIDWSSVAFLSTNSAYNIRTSQIMEQFQC